MKRMLLSLAVTGLLFSACSKSETVAEGNHTSIGFDAAYVGKPVGIRSVAENTQDNLTAFMVYGGYQGEAGYVPVFQGDLVSKGTPTWTYSNIKYWMPGKQYTFSAFAPQGAVTPTVNNGYLTFDYTAADLSADDQTDLIYAAKSVTSAATGGTNAPVQMNFKHLLSMIKFTFSTNLIGAQVTVTKLEITGVDTKATFTGDASENYGAWDNWSEPTTAQALPGVTGVIVKDTPQACGAFVVIPQPVSVATDQVTVKITYSITGAGLDMTDAVKEATIPTLAGGWEAGKRYNYTAAINLNPIEFSSPTVTPWDTESWDDTPSTPLQ